MDSLERTREWTSLRADRLRLLVRIGVGFDNVDLDACTRRGIAVTITPRQRDPDAALDRSHRRALPARRADGVCENVLAVKEGRDLAFVVNTDVLRPPV